jgi:predicted neutral ceramidase superfamily lipid hydrolase
MARKAKKTVSSMSYSLQKLQRRISTVKPSNFVLAVIAIAFVVFLFGGGLYSLIVKPYPAVYYGGRFLFVYPQLSEQFISDSLIAMIFYAMGIIGLATMYQSTKYAYKPRQAYMMFLVGAALLIIAYVSIEAVMRYWKGV